MRRGRPPHVFLATVAIVLLIASACGSTSKPEAKDRTASDDTAATATDEGGEGTASPTGGTSRSRSSGTIGASTAEFPPAPVVAGGGPVRLGVGVTANSIKIGFNFSAPLGPAFAIVGFGGTPEGENTERIIIDALVKHYNTHGGLAGRKIIPVYNEYDAANSDSWEVLAAQACEKFVNDEKVFAVAAGHVGFNDALSNCLAKGKTPLMQQQQWPYDTKYIQDYSPYLYQPSRMRPERWVPAYIKGLKDAGYFTKGYKLGLMRFDSPVFTRIAAMMRNELKKLGLVLTSEAVIEAPHSVGDFGPMSSEISSATLQFQAAGITHVIYDEWAGQLPFFGITIADQQDFHPRYGFTSVNLTNTQAQQHSAENLHGSVAVSWLPGQDVAKPDDPRKGGALERCLAIIRAAGVSTNRLYDGTHCDSLFFLEAVLSKTNNITPEGLEATYPKLGTSYDSPYTFATKFGPERPDGASAVRIGRYVDSCTCYRYTSGNVDAG